MTGWLTVDGVMYPCKQYEKGKLANELHGTNQGIERLMCDGWAWVVDRSVNGCTRLTIKHKFALNSAQRAALKMGDKP